MTGLEATYKQMSTIVSKYSKRKFAKLEAIVSGLIIEISRTKPHSKKSKELIRQLNQLAQDVKGERQ